MRIDSLFTNTLIFTGADYDEKRDCGRMTTQLERIVGIAKDEKWRTVERLALELRRAYPDTRFPEASISAQLRNLRKIGYRVEARNALKDGLLYEYRVLPRVNPGVGAKRAGLRHG